MNRLEWEKLTDAERRQYAVAMPTDPYNPTKTCFEQPCPEPAGTPWTPVWCARHDAERLERVERGFKRIEEELGRMQVDE